MALKSTNLDSDLLKILLTIKDYENAHPADVVGYEFDYLQDAVGTEKAEEAFHKLEEQELIRFPFEGEKSARTTLKGRSICETCGWLMLKAGGPFFEVEQVLGPPIEPKRQRQYRYFCDNPDCPNSKEEPILVLEDIE